MVRGSCLCGEHAYRAEGELTLMHHCHCGRCRKAHGAAFSTWVAVAEDGFAYERGGEKGIRFESSPGFERLSCAICGSPLPGPPVDGRVFLPAAQLEGDPGVRPEAHIFTASKAPWFEIEDGLPGFEAWPPGVPMPVQADRAPQDAPGPYVRGSCLCGAVAFRVEGSGLVARHCHCSRCRKVRGAAHASNWVTALDAVRFTRGADRVREYRHPEARYFTHAFCDGCGSSLPRLDTGRGIAVVAMGALDDPPPIVPSEHIWVGSHASWYDVPGDLPMYEGAPPG